MCRRRSIRFAAISHKRKIYFRKFVDRFWATLPGVLLFWSAFYTLFYDIPKLKCVFSSHSKISHMYLSQSVNRIPTGALTILLKNCRTNHANVNHMHVIWFMMFHMHLKQQRRCKTVDYLAKQGFQISVVLGLLRLVRRSHWLHLNHSQLHRPMGTVVEKPAGKHWSFLLIFGHNWRQAEAWIVLLAGADEVNALAQGALRRFTQ